MDTDATFSRTQANRLRTADLLARLTPEQWRTPSLCSAWTVREVAGHMLMAVDVSIGRFLLELLRDRGSFERTNDRLSRRLGQQSVDDLVATLREKSGVRFAPPGLGPLGPFTDACIHLRDIARPLASDVTPPLADWREALDFLVSPVARRGFVPSGRLAGLRLRATDQEWHHGDGALLSGPSEALAMAAAGRAVALADLTGDGVALLGGRL